MELGRYLLGALLLAATVVPLAAAAAAVRARAAPEWRGAPARLAEAVLTLSALVVLAELLGTVGALRPGALAAGGVLIGVAVLLTGRRPRRPANGAPAASEGPAPRGSPPERPAEPPAATPSPPDPPPPGRPALLVALLAVVLVVFQWGARSAEVLGRGMADPDTLWYHMPFAARFAQSGRTTPLHFAESEPITTFHPAGTELLHGVGISLLGGSDLLSPFLNLGFAALALLGGWCIGRPRGAGPGAVVAVAAVLLMPVMVQTQPGEAANDVAVLALLLAAAGLLAGGAGRRGPLAVAGAAAGLAAAMKLSALAAVGALSLGVIVLALRRRGQDARRGALVLAYGLPLVVTGAFWYARNLAQVGNPLPWLPLGIGPLRLPSPRMPETEASSASVARYLGEPGAWRDLFALPLHDALGPAWPAAVVLAAAGATAALLARRAPVLRMLGVVAVVAGLAYLVTPGTAAGPEGLPLLFGLNLRFATPALVLGLALLPAAPALARTPRRRAVVLAALALMLVLTLAPSGLWPAAGGGGGLALTAAVAAGAAGLAVLARRGAPRVGRLALGGVLALALVAVGWPVSERYHERRYAERGPTLAKPSGWAQRVRGERIAISGYLLQYPLYGPDASNRVEYVGRQGAHGNFAPPRGCAAWRRALNAGRFRYVVTAPLGSVVLGPTRGRPGQEPPEARWTRTAAGARELVAQRDAGAAVFRLDGPLDPGGCAPR